MFDKISILGHLESDKTTMHGPRFPYMDRISIYGL